MTHRTRRIVNWTAAVVVGVMAGIFSAGGRPAVPIAHGQEPECRGCSRTQDLVNEQISARIDSSKARIDDIQRRVEKIEEMKPDAIVEHIRTLDDRFGDQQKLLWAIIVGIIVNLLTSAGKFPKGEAAQAVIEGVVK